MRRRATHSTPHVVAIVHADGRRKYFRCNTREQALAHKPAVIEYVNGFGQVTKRERIEAAS